MSEYSPPEQIKNECLECPEQDIPKKESRAARLLAKANNGDVLAGPKVLSYGETGLVLGVLKDGRILYAEGELKGKEI